MAQTDNCLFLYRNYADTAAVTQSSQVTGAEATFAQTIDPGEPWRATGIVSEWIAFDFGTGQNISHAAAVAHNLDTTGTIRVQAGNDATFATNLVDTGDVEAWEPVSGLGFDGFGSTLGGYPILNSFNDFRPLKYFDLGGTFNCRYVRFTLKNPTNAAITGVALGYAFAGLGAQLAGNFGFDWENKWADPSDFVETEASVRIKARRSHRELTLALPNIAEGEAFGVWDDIKRAIGAKKPMIVVPFPTAGSPKRYRTTIYGIPQDKQGTKNPSVRRHTSTLMIRELAA